MPLRVCYCVRLGLDWQVLSRDAGEATAVDLTSQGGVFSLMEEHLAHEVGSQDIHPS